jgi:hypothetical protein
MRMRLRMAPYLHHPPPQSSFSRLLDRFDWLRFPSRRCRPAGRPRTFLRRGFLRSSRRILHRRLFLRSRLLPRFSRRRVSADMPYNLLSQILLHPATGTVCRQCGDHGRHSLRGGDAIRWRSDFHHLECASFRCQFCCRKGLSGTLTYKP